VYIASRQAFLEMALAGITSVGEFHYLHHAADGTPYADREELAHQVIRAARDVGLRICLLRVGYARAGFQVAANPRQRRFLDAAPEDVLRAVEALERAVSLSPDEPVILEHLGDAYLRASRSEEAAGAWRRALDVLALDPESAEPPGQRVLLERKLKALPSRSSGR